tara:strand:- start:10643 stop:10945 length:303 start_codon:yes stop_codon:yes gene_type:complete
VVAGIGIANVANPASRQHGNGVGRGIVIGGRESTQKTAHDQVEAYNVKTGQWRDWPSLERGRHGSGFAIVGDHVYTASGSGGRGGSPELTSIERLQLITE